MMNRHFIYSPDSAETNITPADLNKQNEATKKIENKKPLSFFEKIKKALQEWSNNDKKDEDFDNTQV